MITRFDVFLITIGPVILRPIIVDNGKYLGACLFYAIFLGWGKAFLSLMDEE